MKTGPMQNRNRNSRRFPFGTRILLGAVTVAVILVVIFGINGGSGGPEAALSTFPVRKGKLVIDVLESGNVEASESLIVRSEVEGRTTIISIIAEGTVLTEEDVEKETVLVELDSSELRNREAEQEIKVEGALADYTDAKESYAIQLKQNESNQKQGELDVKFGRMDLQKYLGERLALAFIEGELDLDGLMESEDLGGEALQRRRELENEIILADEEVERASDELSWTETLEAKGYVTENDLEADRLALKRQEIALQQARTALDLFMKYEFRKEAEKLRSDYEEAERELDRIVAKNRAEESKARAKLKSASATYLRTDEEYCRTREQIKSCIIVATKPGIVVYAGSDHPWHGVRIEEGAEVHERQEILKIPSSTSMVAKTKVHESMIARVQEGQRAVITIDAIPGEVFEGRVTKVGIVPDSGNRWMNPDRKVYLTDVAIERSHPDLKSEMSAQVRIIIDEIEDVLMVPLEAVGTLGENRVCFAMTDSGPEERIVETGDYSDKFIAIKSGLEEGESVVLNPSGLLERSKRSVGSGSELVAKADRVRGATADADR